MAFDQESGAVEWTTEGAPDVARDCVATAPDGTIWAQTADGDELLAIDPEDGTVQRALPVPGPRCATGLQMLPGDELAYGHARFGGRNVEVVDLSTGAVRPLTDEPIESHFLHTSPDGRRAYVATSARPSELLSVSIASGDVLDRGELPGPLPLLDAMRRSYVRADGAVFLVTAGGDGWIVRVDDDGAGELRHRWAVPTIDDVGGSEDIGPQPNVLLPAGGDHELVVGWQSRSGANTLLALDADDGTVAWRARAVEGASGGIHAGAALTDADGNILLPQILNRSTPAGGFIYDVWSPRGLPFGQSPPNLGTETVGTTVLGDDGTLYILTSRGGTRTLVAVAPGVGGVPNIPTTVRPRTVGAGLVTLHVTGAAVIDADELVLRRGEDVRSGALATVAGLRPLDRRARFDLTDAALGEWEVLVRTASGAVVATGATVLVQPADAEVELRVDLNAPTTVRNGRSRVMSVTVTNRSNVDAGGVPVVLRAGLGAGDPRLLTPRFDAAHPDGERPPEVRQLGAADRFAVLALHTVPARGATSLAFELAVPEDAPESGEVELEVAATRCVTPEGATAFAQVADDCFAEALSDNVGDAVGFGADGAAQCVAVGLADLARPRIEDGVIVIPAGPDVSDLGSVAFDCFSDEVVDQAGLSHPIVDIFEAEAFALSVATAYLDCELDAALEGEGDGHDDGIIRTGSSVDPNELHGPPGAGDARYLTSAAGMDYRILFENLPAAAFAAQTVEITSTLDADVDAASFRLGDFGWGPWSFTPPPVSDGYETLLVPPGADHRVKLTFTRTGAELRWRFETLSLHGDAPPEDDAIGFLPPNTAPPAGDGFVSYRVDPAAGVTDGTVVEATADIVFDTNPPITTNTWSNTFDLTPPTTTADAVATPSPANTVPLSWTSSDATSGVVSYLVERVSASSRDVLAPRLHEPRYDVVGRRGEALDIRIRAVDGAGNVEPAETAPVVHVEIAPDAVERLAGANRILTAIDISRRIFPSSGVVVLARQDTYPDSLAGATLAYAAAAPILLTHTDQLPAEVAAEIARLGARNAVLLGGTAAIGDAVAAELQALGLQVERVAGSNRYATAADIAGTLPASAHAFVVEGAHADATRGWPEALLVAPWAALAREPLLLVEAGRLPHETAAAIESLGIERVTVVGSEEQVSAEVVAALADLGVTVQRISGADRYHIGLAVDDAAEAAGVGSLTATWVATGRVFADALTSGASVAATGGRLLLIDGLEPDASQVVLDELARRQSDIAILRLVGGTAAIDADAEARVRAALTM